MRSEQASRNARTGDGHGVLCRLSIGLEVARQAREVRIKWESCMVVDDGAVAGRYGDAKARVGQADQYELGRNCDGQSTVGKQT